MVDKSNDRTYESYLEAPMSVNEMQSGCVAASVMNPSV